MNNIVLLFACLAIGVLLRLTDRVHENAHIAFNAFIVNIALPALILQQVHRVNFRAELAYSVAMPWFVFFGSATLFWALARALRLPRSTFGALAVVGGLGNTSFVGLPMIEAFYSLGDTATGILIDQLGSYLVLSTVGIALISACSESAVTARDIGRRVATFPPLIALVVAVVLMPVGFPVWLTSVLGRLGGTLAPLALVSVGLQIRLSELAGNRRLVAMGLGYKLLLAPLFVVLFYTGLIGLRGRTLNVTVFEAAMPPMIGGSIVAIQYGLDAKLITLMVGVGTVLAFMTLPLWWEVTAML